jgi:hypothetical protein
MRLTLIIGTRGRPDALLASVKTTLANVRRGDTRVLLCVDLDDAVTLDALHRLPADERLIVSAKAREDSRGEKCGRAFTEAPADLYAVGHDCTPILTPGFDQIIAQCAETCFPDGIGVVNSPMANASFPIMQTITAKLAQKLGYIYNPAYPFWFIDHELDDIARMLGRNPYVEIEIEHLSTRPAKTLRLRDLDFWTRYMDLTTVERRQLVHAIIDGEDFIAPPHVKAVLKAAHPAIEARSFNINHSVRSQAGIIEAQRGERGPPDPGYQRLKYAAEEKLIAMGVAQRVAA